VRGKARAEAIQTLNSAGWTHFNPDQFQITHNPALHGKVVAESPTPGIAYPQSTTITLTIYRYVKPVPTCTSGTPTTTTTPTGPSTTISPSPPPTVLPQCPS
jgi:beta-lactam-binding protein with PASTA domain